MKYKLYVGRKDTGIAIEQDPQWPGMWCIHDGKGGVSDMLSLQRAHDRAASLARDRFLGLYVHWKAVTGATGDVGP
jgi:hypothetical protein